MSRLHSRATRSHAVATLTILALLTAACGSQASPTSSPSQATPSPEKEVDLAWHTVGGGPIPVGGLQVTGVAVSGRTVVATTNRSFTNGDVTAPAFWVSQEGKEWTAASLADGEAADPQAVVSYADGFVAVGWDGCPTTRWNTALAGCTPAAWTSADGLSWTAAEVEAVADGGLNALAIWHGKLIAVGGRITRDAPGGAAKVLVMQSDDGTSWSRVETASLRGIMTDVAVSDDQLVAVGLSDARESGSPPAAAAWGSTDTHAWSREVLPAGASPMSMGIAVAPNGFIASEITVGAGMGGAAWLRTDAWTRFQPSSDWGTGWPIGVAGGTAGNLLVGFAQSRNIAIFGSTDGTRWLGIPAVGDLPYQDYYPLLVTWQAGSFYIAGMQAGTYEPLVLSGLVELPSEAQVAAISPRPTPSPPPTPAPPPVILLANGSATAGLQLEGFTAQPDGSLQCASRDGATEVARVQLYDVGAVAGMPMQGSFMATEVMTDGSSVDLSLQLRRNDALENGPSWQGQAIVTDLAEDGLSARLTLELELVEAMAGDAAESWPAALRGTIDWQCDAWQTQQQANSMPGNGSVNADLDAPGWSPSEGPVTCMYELGPGVARIEGVVGQLNGSDVTLSLDMPGLARIGRLLSASLARTDAESPTGQSRIQASLEVTAVDPGDQSGSGRIRAVRPSGDESWAGPVSGTITWRCPGKQGMNPSLQACPITRDRVPSANIALRKEVTASSQWSDELVEGATDGDFDHIWNSGTYAIGWVEVDLGRVTQLAEVRLVVAQSPAGYTEHHLYGRTESGSLVEIGACGGVTSDGQTLQIRVDSGAAPVTAVRVETMTSPSWVAWREIQAFAAGE